MQLDEPLRERQAEARPLSLCDPPLRLLELLEDSLVILGGDTVWGGEAQRAIVPAGPNGIFGSENYGNKFPGEAAVYMGIVTWVRARISPGSPAGTC